MAIESVKQFPEQFIWGVATSAYQIEGAPFADGAGRSIWDDFCQQPGRIRAGDRGDLACDHYRRHSEDIALMRDLGVQAYRFSIAWTRIFPEGRGRINRPGLDFYQRLIDELLTAGIEPWPTLYHWDLPAGLDQQGGWAARDSARWFADYAHTIFRALGDQVRHWVTLNEPWVINHCGYLTGEHAPGNKDARQVPWVTHNLLRAHALTVQAFRADGDGEIGLVVNLEPQYAFSPDSVDLRAVQRMQAYKNQQYLDPVLLGHYPEEMPDLFPGVWPDFAEDDMQLLQTPFDFLGINYYTRSVVKHAPNAPFGAEAIEQYKQARTTMGWEIYAQGLRDTLAWVQSRYGNIPLYITENGGAFEDPVADAQGRINDQPRIDYLQMHFEQAYAAIQSGIDLRGYFVWSLLDNFEWSQGYAQRFGLVQVDPETHERRPKASFSYYRDWLEIQSRRS